MVRRLVIAVIGACLLFATAGIARANGNPLRVVLTYLPEVSNWGPRGATGIAEIVLVEGEVKLTALGLPRLDGEVYVAWLVNSKANHALSLGQFNADSQGEARLEKVLPQAIPDLKWDMLLLTVEKPAETWSTPGERRAIAGYISDHAQLATAPLQLPRTGGVVAQQEVGRLDQTAAASANASRSLVVAALVVAAATVSYHVLRRRGRGKTTGK